MSEVEFLRRELGITWQAMSATNLVKTFTDRYQRGLRSLLIVSDPLPAMKVVDRLPLSSVVLILLSGERPNPLTLELAKKPAIHKIYRNYSVVPLPWVQTVKTSMSALIDAFLFGAMGTKGLSVVNWLRAITLGSRNKRHLRGWKSLSGKIEYFPLGYTSKFAKSILHLLNSQNYGGSLFELELDEFRAADEGNTVEFSGSLGAWQRRVGLQHAARRQGSSVYVTNVGWRGSSDKIDLAYCDRMLNSKYVFCPPGYSANESFRVYEALICGSMPLRLGSALTQLAANIEFPDLILEFRSFRHMFTSMDSQALAHAEVARIRAEVSEQLRKIRENLLANLVI